MVHVLAFITAKPGQRDALLAAFRANLPNVQAENGCIEYGAAVDATGANADRYVVIEKWESAQALEAHAKSPHMAAFAAKTKDLIASREIQVLMPI